MSMSLNAFQMGNSLDYNGRHRRIYLFFFFPWEGSGYSNLVWEILSCRSLWTTKMSMFIICNLTCGFGLSAKTLRFKSHQQIRGSGALRSQWDFFSVGSGSRQSLAERELK